MPIYPALHVKSLDLPGVAQAGQNLQTGALRNRLVGAQLGQVQQQRQARQQYGPSAVAGDQDALQRLAAIDPDGAARIQDIVSNATADQRKRLEANNLEMAQMASYIASAPNEPQKQSRWAEVRRSSPEVGRAMPESFDQNWLDLQTARIMSTDQLLKQDEVPKAQSPAGKLASDLRGGLISQEEYDRATAAGGAGGTALTQNVAFLRDQLGMSTREAVDLLQRSKTDSREEMVFNLASRLMTTQFIDRDDAKAQASELYDTIFAPEAQQTAPAPQPTSPGILERAGDAIGGFLSPQSEAGPTAPVAPAAPAEPAAPGMGLAGPGMAPRPAVPPATAAPELPRPVESMELNELSDVVSQYGDSLSPEQLRQIDARLTALGRPPAGR